MADQASDPIEAPAADAEVIEDVNGGALAGCVDFNAVHDAAKAEEKDNGKLLDKNAEQVIAAVEQGLADTSLTSLRESEANAKNRTTVLAAIDARIVALGEPPVA